MSSVRSATATHGHKSSYYGMSVINPPVWEEREIAGYLFLGGLAGGGLAARSGRRRHRPATPRTARQADGQRRDRACRSRR